MSNLWLVQIGPNLRCRGDSQSDPQLPNHFSISKSLQNSDFLFEIDAQAGQVLKSTSFLNFHPVLNPGVHFEILAKTGYARFDF